jgi:hypothetical protein
LRIALIKQLAQGTYECLICMDRIRRVDRVWSCDCCWAVFHLDCIRKWACTTSVSASNLTQTGWRCPGCQFNRTATPDGYVCFCGKSRDPAIDRFITTHTCGQPCRKSLHYAAVRSSSIDELASVYQCPHQWYVLLSLYVDYIAWNRVIRDRVLRAPQWHRPICVNVRVERPKCR